jgi:hypothetical protein
VPLVGVVALDLVKGGRGGGACESEPLVCAMDETGESEALDEVRNQGNWTLLLPLLRRG